MLRSTLYLVLTAAGLLLLVTLVSKETSPGETVDAKRQLVSALGLTDLALFSEARYTRHPSQADLFAAFQDIPAALEHFPSGSLIGPAPIGITHNIGIQKKKARPVR